MADVPARGRRLRTALLVAGAVVLLLLVFTAWQAWTVRSALLSVRDDLPDIARELDAGDVEAAREVAERVQDSAERADFHSHTPVWWASQHLPGIGDDVSAVRVVSDAAHALADGVVAPMVEAGFTPEQFRPTDGRIAIEPLRRAGEFLDDAAPRVADVDAAVGALETGGLLEPLRAPVEDLQETLDDAAGITRAAAIATELLPGMLGGDGDRTYLLVFQNNAEVRATGGMPGTLGVLTARDGRLSLKRTLEPVTLENGEPIAPLTEGEQELFGRRMLLRARAANVTPHFPRAAQLLSEYWERSGRAPLDGVVSVDPVALSYLIDYTGPITLDNGTELTSDNVVELLLQDVYERYDVSAQDEFFAQAARATFDSVIQADGSVGDLVAALSRGIDERRVAVWSARPKEQRLLAGEDVADELPQDTGRPELGIYVNDERADKLSYYLHADPTVTPESCSDAGVQRLAVEVDLRSSAPRSGWPTYVTGFRNDGLPRGLMRNGFYLFAPVGGRIGEVTLDGEELTGTRAALGDRPAVHVTIDLKPKQSKTLRYVVETGEDQTEDIRLLTTPLADGTGGEQLVESGCAD